MPARLQYAKVIDQELFLNENARIHPGLNNAIQLHDEPGKAGAFLVLRGWQDGHGTVTEQWRIEGSGGGKVYESLPREVHLPTAGHLEKLEDEINDLEFQYAADDYHIVFTIDEREVARVKFEVRSPKD
jgi:hypothetical protein